MPKLTLLRHAKSSWEDKTLSDFDRPLSPRGKRDAHKISAYLAQNHISPDFILCSPSQRTKETLARITPPILKTTEIKFDKAIYSAGMGEGLISYLKNLPSQVEHLMIIGHNPTIHEVARTLVKAEQADPELYAYLQRKYPSGSLTHIDFGDLSWAEVEKGGKLIHFVRPKALPKDKA